MSKAVVAFYQFTIFEDTGIITPQIEYQQLVPLNIIPFNSIEVETHALTNVDFGADTLIKDLVSLVVVDPNTLPFPDAATVILPDNYPFLPTSWEFVSGAVPDDVPVGTVL